MSSSSSTASKSNCTTPVPIGSFGAPLIVDSTDDLLLARICADAPLSRDMRSAPRAFRFRTDASDDAREEAEAFASGLREKETEGRCPMDSRSF